MERLSHSNTFRGWFCTVSALLTLLAVQGFWLILPASGLPGTGALVQLTFLVESAGSAFAGSWIAWLLLFGGLVWFYHKLYFGSFALLHSVTAGLLALAFTVFSLLGGSMERCGALGAVFCGKLQLFAVILAALGFYVLFYGLFALALAAVQNGSYRRLRFAPAERLADFVQGKRPLLGAFLLFVLCWLPAWILAFPGALASDAATQLAMYALPDKVFTNHYPFLTTLFYSGVLNLANWLGCPNLALFFLCALQYLFFAFALAHLLRTMLRLGAGKTLRGLSMAVFAVVPLWPIYAVCVQKDTGFAAGVILLVDCTAEFLLLGQKLTARRAISMFLLALLVCLSRNNGIYLMLPLLAALVFALGKKNLKATLSVLAGVLVVYGLTQQVLMPLVKCSKGEKQEMLSIPFQQTARYVKEYGDEVTAEEREIIDGVLIYDDLAKVYDPLISDPVKMPYRYRFYMQYDSSSKDFKEFAAAEKQALSAYWGVWWAQFQKHPLVYFEATLNNIYGYVYPTFERVYGPVELDVSLDAALRTDVADFSQIAAFAPLRTAYSKAATAVGRFPLSCLLFAPCVSVWGFLFAAACLLRKKRWNRLVCLIPSAMTVLICVASPVNACTRYMLCATALLPLELTLLNQDCEVES